MRLTLLEHRDAAAQQVEQQLHLVACHFSLAVAPHGIGEADRLILPLARQPHHVLGDVIGGGVFA